MRGWRDARFVDDELLRWWTRDARVQRNGCGRAPESAQLLLRRRNRADPGRSAPEGTIAFAPGGVVGGRCARLVSWARSNAEPSALARLRVPLLMPENAAVVQVLPGLPFASTSLLSLSRANASATGRSNDASGARAFHPTGERIGALELAPARSRERQGRGACWPARVRGCPVRRGTSVTAVPV